jgi:Repeat of unknown function (DUF5648)
MPADYFMTTNTSELQQAMDNGYGNDQTVCWIYPSQQSGTTPLYRLLYIAGPGNIHFYTTDEAEKDSCVSSGQWTFEGIAGYLCSTQATGTVPLFRLTSDVTHLYTTSAVERDGLLMCPGWTFEGMIGYVYNSPQPETEQLYRVWQPDPVPYAQTGSVSWVIHVLNNSNSPLLVVGTRGTDLTNVALNQVIPPFGGNLNVASFAQEDLIESWDWIDLLDLTSPQRYQIFVESSTKWYLFGSDTTDYFGYYDPTSSEGNGNPSPFPSGFSTSVFNASDYYIVNTLNATPPVVTTDLQAVTDQLGFLLAGKTFDWSASTTYDTDQHPELAPYLSSQVSIQVAGQAVYPDQNQFTASPSEPTSQTGCYQNSTSIAASTLIDASVSETVTFTWSVTETLSVAWGSQVKAGLPDSVEATTTWQVTLSVGSTQGQSQSNTVTFGTSPTIEVPEDTTTTWRVTYTNQSYTIPFTIPVTLLGSVAIETTAPISSTQIDAIGGQQYEISSQQWLILVPIGALIQFGASLSAGIASLGFVTPPPSPQQAQFNMTGQSSGGPITEVNIGTQSYPDAPPCSSSLPPPPFSASS